jgi:hypothetical protein
MLLFFFFLLDFGKPVDSPFAGYVGCVDNKSIRTVNWIE